MKRLRNSSLAYFSGVLTIITLSDHFTPHPKPQGLGETIFSVVFILLMIILSLDSEEHSHD